MNKVKIISYNPDNSEEVAIDKKINSFIEEGNYDLVDIIVLPSSKSECQLLVIYEDRSFIPGVRGGRRYDG